ncbi:MAG: hypothetical protein IKZ04_06715, partial [Spirochaetaceae bacterium]|nr:hypothetical protein [Spirochaetaceae bacterium]
MNYAENGKTLGVRVLAVDNDTSNATSQLAGAWSPTLHISVNNSVPQFENLTLKRFNGNTVIAERTYEPDMYIKGNDWYLCGTVKDSDGIKDVKAGSQTLYTNSSSSNTSYEMKIAVTGSGTWEKTITATDLDKTSSKDASLNISINIDNTAPAFNDGANEDTLVLYKDSYGATILSTSEKVQNSNGYFTLAGKVTEEGSGFERMVFYFQRNGTDGKNRVYNPMVHYGANRTDNRADIGTDVEINADGLPVKTLTVTRSNDGSNAPTDNLTYNKIDENTNIRKGGLVKIGGVYRLISEVSEDTVKFTPSCSPTFTEAEFVYGMVIDNTGESQKQDGTIKNDDGDGMVESYSKSGYSYTWDATIDSTNIPDGPIEVHCVVFDVAGNSRHGKVTSQVSNNAPRITSVKLGTNLNGNKDLNDEDIDIFEDSEYNIFYANIDSTGNGNTSYGVEIWNLDTAEYQDKDTTKKVWVAKNGLSVKPEFVGGTAPMYYIYSKQTGNNQTNLTDAEKGTATSVGNAINLNNNTLTNSGENQINTYRFTFWDSTEDLKAGTDSQWSILNVKLKQDLVDDVAPQVVINPLYWESKDDNSLYQENTANGHIELSSDLPASFNGNGVNDKDDKVSGKITFTGTAYDNVRLSTLTFSFDKFNGNVSFDTSNNTWSSSGTMDTDSYEFSVKNIGLDQNGHQV